MIALAIRGLQKTFGATVALAGLDLEVEQGDFCVLLGPSGCGKSTALRCVAGLESPTAGEIRIHDRRVDAIPAKDRNVAMVFQSYALYPHMSVAQNIAFPLRVRGLPRRERDALVRETARLLRIEELLDRRPRELSGGQRQRVAIGRAIVREPLLFLFDEPLSNLDARLRTEMREELARLHRRLGATMLYVTHDQVEAMTLGRTIAVLHRGRVEQIGAPEDIYLRPATRFVAAFVGTPPMNFVAGRIAGKVFRAEGLTVAVEGHPDGPCDLGVRPEHVRLGEGSGRGRIAWVENRGADRYAHVSGPWGRLVARVPTSAAVREGETVPFALAPGDLHVFPAS